MIFRFELVAQIFRTKRKLIPMNAFILSVSEYFLFYAQCQEMKRIYLVSLILQVVVGTFIHFESAINHLIFSTQTRPRQEMSMWASLQ